MQVFNGLSKHQINKQVGLLFLISLLWLGLNSVSLLVYPTVTSDEALVGLVAYRPATDGQQQIAVSEYDPFIVYPFRLYLTGLTQCFNLFGVGLLQARAFSLLAGYISGWLMFALGRQLYDDTVGVLAGTLFWFSIHVFWTSHYVRPEMWVAVANLGGLIAGWWFIKQPTAWRAALLGFIAAAILDVYLSTISTSLTLGVVVLVCAWKHRRWQILTAAAVGLILGLSYYLAIQFLPDWQRSLAGWLHWMTLGNMVGTTAGGAWTNRLLKIPFSFYENYVSYSLIGWLELVYWLSATTWLLKRRSLPDIYVLASGGLALGVYGLVFAGGYHTLDAWPMPVLMMAVGLSSLTSKLHERLTARLPAWLSPARLLAVATAPLLLIYLASSIYYSWTNREYDYVGYTKQLAQFTSAEATILGEGAWWWGFRNQPYWWDEPLEAANELSLEQARQTVAQTIQSRAITTVFLDNNLGAMPYPSDNTLMRQALEEYLTANCELQGEVNGIAYGIDFGGPGEKRTRVYSCQSN